MGEKRRMLNGPQRQRVYDSTVNELLSPNGKFWNASLIREVFDYVVVNDILQVPLIDDVIEDKWNCKEGKNGCYNVRSGYRLWIKELGSLGFRRVDGNWSSLGNVKAPPRVKHLLWRIFRDCLHTRVRLQQYHVVFPAMCLLCDHQMEDS